MNKFSIEIKWGIIFTIAALVWMYIEKALGWHDELVSKHAIFTNIFAIVAIVVYVLALRDKKLNFYNGQMSWTQGFISGVIVSVVVAILAPLAQYVTHEFITPNYFENVIAYSIENDMMNQEGAEAYFSLTSYMMQAAFGALAMGVVTSAIVALFVKSKKS